MNEFDRLPLVAAVLAGLTLLGVVANAVLVLGNQKFEAEVQARQQFINQSLQLYQVTTALLQALAQAAVGANDAALRGLLAESGVTINVNDPPAAKAPPPKSP